MPPELLPYVPIAALCISVFALIVSGANLGWSIYKEIGLRARLRISFGLKSIHHSTFSKPLSRLTFSVTNHGPGKCRILMLQLRDDRLWRRLFRRQLYAVLMHDYEHPLGGKLPYDLEVGHGMDLTLAIEDSFLERSFTQIGISDSFGRVHWCKRSDVREARKALKRKNEA